MSLTEISESVLLGADAIASCVLSQNENLKLPEVLVEGREGLPFEFRDIRMVIEATLLPQVTSCLLCTNNPCE